MSDFIIKEDDLTCGSVIDLLKKHHENMMLLSPPESVHALDKSQFYQADLQFFSAWKSNKLAGCIALKNLGNGKGEIKAMKTAERFLRQGVAQQLLCYLIKFAQGHDFTQLMLETGSMPAFEPARTLYERNGFKYCGPFGNYSEDPHSVFMQILLKP